MVETRQVLPETLSPRALVARESLAGRGRGRAGNLPHPGSLSEPLLLRPVAPQPPSYRDVVAFPGRRESVAGEELEGRRGGDRQVPGPEPRGQTRPGRASAGARGCECAMRARRGECVFVYVCPRFPLPSLPVLRPDRAASDHQNLAGQSSSTPGHSRGEASSGTRGRGAAAPPAGIGRGSPLSARRSRSEALREQAARRLPRLPEAAGPARRPPRLFPFSLHPLAPSPHALQGSQTGLQQSPRRDCPPQLVCALESVHGD